MRKAVTPVIAITLLLIITVGIIGTTYVFISGMFTSQAANVLNVVGSANNQIIVRNDGTNAVASIAATLDGNSVNLLMPSSIQAGEAALIKPIAVMEKGSHKLMLCTSSICNTATLTVTVPIGVSCKDILNLDGSAVDGLYDIAPTSDDIFQVYCDMANGGWTLIMKTLSSSNTLKYSSNYWTTSNTLNPEDLTLAANSAKYKSFNTVSFQEIRGCVTTSTSNCLSHTFGAQKTSALSLFSGPFLQEGPTRAQFDAVFSLTAQSNCGTRGFNNDGSRKVRWGYLGNNENDCNSVDSVLGFGISSGTGSSGVYSSCCSVADTGKNTWLWVR
ncbi:MAG: hypothetical protein HYT71_02325 [Candidatus Aenigmarchaeota archaeon]|nr:hypothetical protein [Candidatus Aenigmarchaeota archaeon]